MPSRSKSGKSQEATPSEPRKLAKPVFAQPEPTPVFAEPEPTPDPTKFRVKHPSDNPAYKQIDELNKQHKLAPLPFPAPRGLPEPKLTLAAVLDEDEDALQKRLAANGQVVFHATGDTGSTRGPQNQNLVSDKMVNDFTDEDKETPSFSFISATSSTASARRNITTTNFMSPTVTIRRRSSPLPAITTA